MALLARMIQVSLIGFAVGGAFVNIGNWDMMYYLAIAALATARVVERFPKGQPNVRALGPRNRQSRLSGRSVSTASA